MKKNLILSIVSLCFATLLIIFISFAWLTTNSAVSAGITVNVTGGSEYSYILQYYDDTSYEWVAVTPTSPLEFEKFDPGDTMYLRFVIESRSATNGSIQAQYKNYSSDITDEITVDLTDKKIYYNGVSILDVVDNTDTATKTAFPYITLMEGEIIYYITASGKITVAENYKIEKAMSSYNLGTSTEDLDPTELPNLSTKTRYSLEQYIFGPSGETLFANSRTYCYFTLEYQDFESSASDGTYASNNYFIYQSFEIDTINVYL